MDDKNVSKHKMMSDKEFYLKLVLSLMSIIGCIGMLLSSALAIFVGEAQSTENVIKAGSFDVCVDALCDCAGGYGFDACSIEQDMHTYVITPDGSVDGYAKIILDDGVERIERYTEQLNSPITITVQAQPGTSVTIKAFWGNVNNNLVSGSEFVSDGKFIFHSISPPPEEDEITDESGESGESGEEEAQENTDASSEGQEEDTEELTEDFFDNKQTMEISQEEKELEEPEPVEEPSTDDVQEEVIESVDEPQEEE